VAGSVPFASRPVRAQDKGEVRVLVGGGDWGKANIAAYAKPFEEQTGIKVTAIPDQVNLAQAELMVNSGNVTIDVISYGQSGATALANKGLLEQIDYGRYGDDQLSGLADFAKKPWGVAALVYSYVMVYNTEAYPASKPRPSNWAEFWDVDRFPGVRTLITGQSGTEGPWEEALLADGVAPADIYPMDIDRIFRSLDRIKPHVRRWWRVGSEVQQIMHDKAFDLTNSYDGRAMLLAGQGFPVEVNRNQAKLTWDYWLIPKGGPNVENAQKFVEFATRADRQADFAQRIPYGPSNLKAYEQIPEERGRQLASHPEYVANSIPLQTAWYTEKGADGKTNLERLIQRWNEWILA
jgi:putative spermidine/putrescine transport system substrate-binding protein